MIGFTVVSLCLKESLAMMTRGRFVCHVHCLVHDNVVRSSPCGPHHENFGQNLYHMFVSGLFCKPILCFRFGLWYLSCFDVKCWFHTFQAVFSYFYGSANPSWSLSCHANPFQPACFSSSGSDHFQHPQDQLKVFSTLFVSYAPKLSLFPPLPPFFLQRLGFLNQVSILFMWSLFILFR